MRNRAVMLAQEAAYQVLDALSWAIQLAVDHGYVVDQIRFEDAYRAVRDATFPALPDS